MSYETNFYYHPEYWNMKLIGEIEYSGGCYEFTTRIFLLDLVTNKVYTARDSGCSCPTPFEDFYSLDDLSQVTDISYYRSEINDELKPYSMTSLPYAQSLLKEVDELCHKQYTTG